MSTSFSKRFVPVRTTRDYGTDALYEKYILSHVREYYTNIVLWILEQQGMENYMSENVIFLQWPIIINEVVCEYITDPSTHILDQLIINSLLDFNTRCCLSFHINQNRLYSKIHNPFPWNADVVNSTRLSSRVIENEKNQMLNP
jgi:hypothetical protein